MGDGSLAHRGTVVTDHALGLQRRVERGVREDGAAERGKGIGAERSVKTSIISGTRSKRTRLLIGEVGRERLDQGDATRSLAEGHVELGGVEHHEIARRRLLVIPRVGDRRGVARGSGRPRDGVQEPVGDHLVRLGHGDRQRVGRLVPGVAIDRIPDIRARRFADREDRAARSSTSRARSGPLHRCPACRDSALPSGIAPRRAAVARE